MNDGGDEMIVVIDHGIILMLPVNLSLGLAMVTN